MKTIYFSGKIKFKSSAPQNQVRETINSLGLATEHNWVKVRGCREYVINHFDILSHLKLTILYYIIKEMRECIQEFNFKLYEIHDLPKTITLNNNKLRCIK